MPHENSQSTSHSVEGELFDLDVLRGWKENRAPQLDASHKVPYLARLVCYDEEDAVRVAFGIHGPEVYVGRFHPQHGPVDLILSELEDHEIYKLSAPHARFSMDSVGNWTVRTMAPSALTRVNGELITDTQKPIAIKHGDTVCLGVVELSFEVEALKFQAWKDHQKKLLLAIEEPSLFLIRAGAVCGPKLILDPDERTIIGRTFPSPGDLPGDVWNAHTQPDWDLAGLRDKERKFIGYRHCELWCEGEDDWFIKPISPRQRTYVNRVEISGVTPLMPGDEVGLGSVLLHFHHPSNIRASTDRRTVELPSIVDWKQAHARPAVDRKDPDA